MQLRCSIMLSGLSFRQGAHLILENVHDSKGPPCRLIHLHLERTPLFFVEDYQEEVLYRLLYSLLA